MTGPRKFFVWLGSIAAVCALALGEVMVSLDSPSHHVLNIYAMNLTVLLIVAASALLAGLLP